MFWNSFMPDIPLPVISLMLPFAGAAALIAARAYELFLGGYRHGAGGLKISLRFLKFMYFSIVFINLIVSAMVWLRFSAEGTAFYAFDSGGWSRTLTQDGAKALVQVDALGVVSAVVMAFVAFLSCLRALAEKVEALTPQKVIFYLLTLLGIQGIFYSNGLFALAVYITLSQLGATGLFKDASDIEASSDEFVWYLASRAVPLLMFFSGTALLYYYYKTDNIAVLAMLIKPGAPEKLAYALLAVPMLFLFIKPSGYVTDSARRIFFAIRAQAALFVVFRIVFSLYGPMSELGKMPLLYIGVGCIVLLAAVLLLAAQKDPIKFAEILELSLKGFLLVAMGVSLNGVYSAQAASAYGFGALESMVSLWIIFLPLSAALSLVCCLFKQKTGAGVELWRYGGLLGRLPLSSFAFLLSLCAVAGLPPFVGYSAKQFLYRSSNYISPLLMILLFIVSAGILVIGIRYTAALMFGPGRGVDGGCDGDSKIALPLLLMTILYIAATIMPGRTYDSLVLPSVDALMNNGAHSIKSLQGGVLK